MKRPKFALFARLIAEAPALVIPFGGGARLVPVERLPLVESGIITLSPMAIFFLECRFFWERCT